MPFQFIISCNEMGFIKMKRILIFFLLIFNCCAGSATNIQSFPSAAPIDKLRQIQVNDLRPGEEITLQLSHTDNLGRFWLSQAIFRADREGTIKLIPNSATELLYNLRHLRSSEKELETDSNRFAIDIRAFRGSHEVAFSEIVFFQKQPIISELSLNIEGMRGSLFYPPSDTPLPLVIVTGNQAESRAKLLAKEGIAAISVSPLIKEPHLPHFLLENLADFIEHEGRIDSENIALLTDQDGAQCNCVLSEYLSIKELIVLDSFQEENIFSYLKPANRKAWCEAKNMVDEALLYRNN